MAEKLICVMAVIGFTVTVMPEIMRLSGAVSARRTISREVRRFVPRKGLSARGPFLEMIARLMESSGTDDIFKTPEAFTAISVILCLTSFFLSLRALGIAPALFAACGALMAPYGWSYLRLSAKRSGVSREGDVLIHELINNYRISSCNMKEAIDLTASGLDEKSFGRGVMMQLARTLNNAVSEIETERALDRLRYSFATAWGSILASNISLALKTGISVEKSLDDLSRSIAKSKSVVEHGKRQNYESRMMLRYLVPVCYIMSFLAAVFFFGFTPVRFARFQFATKPGLMWFAVSLACWIIATGTEKYISSEKMDI